MKTKLLLPAILTFMLASFNYSCKREDSFKKFKLETKLTTQSIPTEILTRAKQLYAESTTPEIRNEIAKNNVNKRVAELLAPNWQGAVRYPQIKGYSLIVVPTRDFRLDNKKIGFLRKFIFVERAGKVTQARLVEILADAESLRGHSDDLFVNYNANTIGNFTGSIITYDMNYRFLRGLKFKNGSQEDAVTQIVSPQKAPIIDLKDKTKSSIQCYDRYETTYYSDGSSSSVFLYTWCQETGGSSGGSTSSGSSSGGSSSGGSAPGGGGDGPILTPGDYGFPTTPYDGVSHRYYYPNGKSILFTYSSSLQAWLLPELQIFKNEGYTMTASQSLGGKIVGAIPIALAEPTPIGEIVVMGLATVYILVYAYENIPKFLNERQKNHEYCVTLFEACKGTSSYNKCGMCLSYCEVHGEWDHYNCPNPMSGY